MNGNKYKLQLFLRFISTHTRGKKLKKRSKKCSVLGVRVVNKISSDYPGLNPWMEIEYLENKVLGLNKTV